MDERKVLDLLSRLRDGESSMDIASEIPMPFQRLRVKQSKPAASTCSTRGLRVDQLALSICPKDFPNSAALLPFEVYGDGNCLFRAASLVSTGSEASHLELRLRATVELCLHADFHAKQLEDVASSQSSGEFSTSSLLQSTLKVASDDAFIAARRKGCTVREAYASSLHVDAREAAKSGVYVSLQYISALATVTGVPIRSVYPEANANLRGLYHTILHPRPDARRTSGADHPGPFHIMFSALRTTKHGLSSGLWMPNHYVPLLSKQPESGERKVPPSSSPSKHQRRPFTILDFIKPKSKVSKPEPKGVSLPEPKKAPQPKPKKVSTPEPNVSRGKMPRSPSSSPEVEEPPFKRAQPGLLSMINHDPVPPKKTSNPHPSPNKQGFVKLAWPKKAPQSELAKQKKSSDVDDLPSKHKPKERTFQESWKNGFPWLKASSDSSGKTLMFCTWCVEYDKGNSANSFVQGASTMKRETVVKHSRSQCHKQAEEAHVIACRRAQAHSPGEVEGSIEMAVQKMKQAELDTVKKLFRTAAYLAIQERPFSDFKSLINLQVANGVELMNIYRNDKQARSFVHAIADKLRLDTKQAMASSPFFGVLCDSSTDSSTIDEEIIAVRFLQKGTPKFDFLDFRPLTRANADCILQTVCASLSEHCPTWKHSLVAFGADGAPVNFCNTGVATKLRASVPHIVPIHGCAHRLELAIKDAAKQCSLLSSADDIMEHSFKMYHKSPLCWQGLKEKGNELNLVVLKPTKLKGTRWVAHRERALKVVLVDWPVLVQHTNDVRQGRSAMQGRATKLYKELTKPGTVIFLYLLYDLLVVLGRLSRTLQLSSATIETVRRAVLSAQSGLLELCNDKTIATRIEGVLTQTEQTSWRHTSADPKSMDGLVGDPELSDNDGEDSDDSSDEVSEDEVTEDLRRGAKSHCIAGRR